MYGGLGDGKVLGHFPGGEHTAIAQSLAPAGQAVSRPNERDLLEIVCLPFPCPMAAFIEDLGDLTISMKVEQTVDLGDQVGLDLAYLGDRQRPLSGQSARCAA